MDGNFSAGHQRRENIGIDACLTHGELFMTELFRYKAHLAVSKEVVQVSCEHRFYKANTAFIRRTPLL